MTKKKAAPVKDEQSDHVEAFVQIYEALKNLSAMDAERVLESVIKLMALNVRTDW